jgi:glycosyltransferase involved in cell wall biosynthesis
MESSPLVSVIIPTYNRAVLLQEAIASVLAQSYAALELIVVDDGSTDATAASLRSVRPLRLVRQDHTGMPGQARNAGARVARGAYLAFLDSDDLWLPHKLAVQVAAAHAAGDAINHTRERWLRSGRVISQRGQRHRRSGDLFADSLRKCIIGPSTVLLRREVFERAGGFREDLEVAEDYELWLRLTARHRVGYVEQESVIKRAGHGDQLSERYGHIELFRLRALRDLLECDHPQHFTDAQTAAAAAELARKARIYAAGCRKRGRPAEAIHYETLAQRWTAPPD